MSAYGAIAAPPRTAAPLPATAWHAPRTHTRVTVHHLTLARAPPALVAYLHGCFETELARGATYPQELRAGEAYTRAAYEAYYWAADVLVGIVGQDGAEGGEDGQVVEVDVERARGGRAWAACVAGCYYVKPNYPGRSSHVRVALRCAPGGS